MSNGKRKLPLTFYRRDDTIAVARDLLGKLLVVPDENGRRVSGMIVETEAYLGIADKAAHSYNGRRTPRNEVMYAGGGLAYVFFIYGRYFQFNVVTGSENDPTAVLVRAVEPVEGIETMFHRRGLVTEEQLTSGPGKLSIAFGIDRSFNGKRLTGSQVWIEEYLQICETDIAVGPRIGIDYAEEFADMRWRFWVERNRFISRAPTRRKV